MWSLYNKQSTLISSDFVEDKISGTSLFYGSANYRRLSLWFAFPTAPHSEQLLLGPKNREVPDIDLLIIRRVVCTMNYIFETVTLYFFSTFAVHLPPSRSNNELNIPPIRQF